MIFDLLQGFFEPDGWLEEGVVPARWRPCWAHSRGTWIPWSGLTTVTATRSRRFRIGRRRYAVVPGMWTASLIYAGATLGGRFCCGNGGQAVNLSGGHTAQRTERRFYTANDCVMGIQRLLKTLDRSAVPGHRRPSRDDAGGVLDQRSLSPSPSTKAGQPLSGRRIPGELEGAGRLLHQRR